MNSETYKVVGRNVISENTLEIPFFNSKPANTIILLDILHYNAQYQYIILAV